MLRRPIESALAAPVGVQDAAGDLTAAGHGVSDGVDGEFRGHPVRDRVPDDPVGEHVFDRAAVELAFARPVLRDIREPQPVGRVGAEHALDVVVEHGRPGLLPFPTSPALRG